MRFLSLSLVLVAAMLTVTACNSKSSDNSDQSSSASATSASDTTNAAATSASDTSGASSPAAAGSPGTSDNSAAAGSEPPSYPGAQTQASGSSSNMGQTAAGKVLTTDDSFDKVYQWYQQNMPAGSEKSHVTSPIQSAVFTIGDPGKGQTSVTLTTSGAKTMITIAHVKM
ncbi:MAG TPA: hypothetical protein VHS56_08230 [Candidatus Cybelea sp.]|jgi:hypothetical protein|nr:hypothetical protein [Candidatus Cybelea sp.]